MRGAFAFVRTHDVLDLRDALRLPGLLEPVAPAARARVSLRVVAPAARDRGARARRAHGRARRVRRAQAESGHRDGRDARPDHGQDVRARGDGDAHRRRSRDASRGGAPRDARDRRAPAPRVRRRVPRRWRSPREPRREADDGAPVPRGGRDARPRASSLVRGGRDGDRRSGRGRDVLGSRAQPSSPPGSRFGVDGSGASVIVASVRSSTLATETAFSSATRTTFVGSMMPASTRSTYLPRAASKP